MYKNLVLDTWYNINKLFIDDTRTPNTASQRKVNLHCHNATLHAPRMWANVQTCFEQRSTASGVICHLYKFSGGCNPLTDNWISEFEFCNDTKINTVAFILCGKGFCFLCLARFRFASACTSKPFRYQCFAAYRFGFKVVNHISTCQYFQLVEKKKCFPQKNAKKVVKSLELVHSPPSWISFLDSLLFSG